jgi:PAS domain S-box-containing protein
MPKASAYWIKLRRGLFAFGALLVGLSILSALWTVRSDRTRVEEEASRNFANLTALLAEQTARSLESVDLVLAAATSDMRVRGIGDPTLREVRMKDRISGIAQIRSLLLLDPDGRVLVDTAGQIPAGIDMSDRTYFTAHRDGSAGRRFVSEPFQGRASGYWEFAVSERVTGTGDRFAGVLAAKMDLAYFDGLYRLLDIGPDGFVELATTDGKVITRVPGPRDAPGVLGTDSDGVLAALKRDGRFTGWSHGVGHAGADPALISAAAIPSLPLHVVVGAPARAVFAPWRAEAVRIGLATLLGSAVVLALVGFAARELARRAAADERTRQSEEALRARQEMLDLAQDAAQAAAFKWRLAAGAADNRWSRALEPMLGLAPGTYDGTYDTWLGLVHAQDRPAVEAAIERARVTGDVSTEYRIVDRDGGVHWLQLKGRLIADADSGAARMVGFMLDVTDRRRAEAEGERQKVLLDELIESAPEAILFYDDAWRIVRVNREFTRIFGYAPEEVLGTDAGVRIVPEDRKAEAEEMRRRMGRGEHVSLEETVRQRKDGSLFDASLLGAPIWVAGKRIGALALLRDISERKRADAEFRRQTALLDELFESAPEAVVLLDLDERVIRTNREFTTLFGYSAEEAVGRTILDLIVPADQREDAHALNADYAAGAAFTVERERQRKDGTRVQISLTAAPITLGGKRIGLYAIYRDISERKLAEAEQARLQRRLRQAEKMEAVGRLAGGIAHDFNNILGGILGYGEMAFTDAAEGTPIKRYTRNILTGANRARDLVDQILTYSRSQRANRTPVEFDQIIGETLELVRGSLPAGIALDLALPDAPIVVVGDPSQLHQLVMNLCSNAVYAIGRSGTLQVVLEPVDVPAERALAHGTLAPGRYARLTVADTGRGMDAATLARIFEPFFTTKEAGRGTGLGLSLVYGIVTDSGGAIQVTSAPDCGSSFEIYLPQTEAPPVAAEASDEPVPRGGGERVLLVDDEESLTVMTAEVLAQLGYEAASFTDGRAALEAFEAAPEAFQVMVTDEVMPALTGTELARRVRRRRPDLPIVLLSGYSGPLLTQQALGAGVSELLKKPVQSRELAAALARVLRRAA